MVQLRTKLKNGDIVEVVTQSGHTPSRDWLTFTKSSRARNKIKHWLNEHQRERAVEIGKKLLEREARKYKIPLNRITDADYVRVAGEYGVVTASDLLAAIGFGKYSSRQVLNKLSHQVRSLAATDADADSESSVDTKLGGMSEAVRQGTSESALRRTRGRRPGRPAGLSRTLL